MDKVYKCPKCDAELKEAMGIQLTKTIQNFLIMEPEILDNMEVECWKCGNVTTASDLVNNQGKP